MSKLTLGENLKTLRINMGLDQKQLAHHLNINASSISNWETNRRSPDLDTLVKLADFFNVSTDYLLGRTTIKNYSLDDNKYLILKLDKDKYPFGWTAKDLEEKLSLVLKLQKLLENWDSTK